MLCIANHIMWCIAVAIDFINIKVSNLFLKEARALWICLLGPASMNDIDKKLELNDGNRDHICPVCEEIFY